MRPRRALEGEARHPRQLRRVNMDRIFAAAMASGTPLTRADIAAATHLSPPTVGSLASDLVELGLLRELGRGPSTGGRRPRSLEFNAHYGCVAGVVLGGTATRLALADLAGRTLVGREVSTPREHGPERVLKWMSDLVLELVSDAAIPPGKGLLAVTAGLPGAVDRERGTVVGLMPGFRNWENVAVAATLERLVGAPVVLENDVNLAVLGEHWRGAAQGHDTCVFISLGVGIGAGILIGGELHRGQHSLAGEIAVMCMGTEHVGRDFGSHGCLETLIGLDSILERWRPATSTGTPRRAALLLDAVHAGDAEARRILDEVATLVGMAASDVTLVIDPSLLVLSGPLVGTGGPLLERVREVVSQIIPRPPRVVCSLLGDQAMLTGSLLVAIQEAREQLRRQIRNAPGSTERVVSAPSPGSLNVSR